MTLLSTRTDEKGFTLLELLLVVGVSALIFAGIATITQAWVNTEIATSSGQHLQRVATVTSKFVDGNWSTLTATDDVATTVAGDPTSPWAPLIDNLEQEGLMPGGSLANPLGTDLIISFRVDNTDPDNVIYRTAVYSDAPVPIKKASEAARQAGNFGGTISTFGGPTRAVGAFGQYDVATTDLATNPLGCAATATESCLIAVVARNGSSLNGSFLYRNAVPGRPELNTMTTDLLMNGNDINNAAAVNTTDLNVANEANLGTVNVTGTSTFNGPTTIGAGLVANGGVDVSGNANFADDVTMASGTLNADTLNTATLQAPSISTNSFNANDLEMNGGAVTVNDNINVNGNIVATGEVFASTVNAGTINANGGDMIVGTMSVQNTMQIDGAVSVSGAVVVDRMVADGCTRIKVDLAEDTEDGIADGYEFYGTGC